MELFLAPVSSRQPVKRSTSSSSPAAVRMGAGDSTGQGWQAALHELETFLGGPATEDVRYKLAKSRFARRHAFVRVDNHSPMPAWWLFRKMTLKLPARPPQLPPEITDVWWWTGHRGWRWSPPSGWSDLGPFPDGVLTTASALLDKSTGLH